MCVCRLGCALTLQPMSASGQTGIDALLNSVWVSPTPTKAERGQQLTMVWPEDNHSPLINPVRRRCER